MTLRYLSANEHAVGVEANGVASRRDIAPDPSSTGVKITVPAMEYLPVEANLNLEDKLLALGRLDPELELEEE